jgi:hypothetical protein
MTYYRQIARLAQHGDPTYWMSDEDALALKTEFEALMKEHPEWGLTLHTKHRARGPVGVRITADFATLFEHSQFFKSAEQKRIDAALAAYQNPDKDQAIEDMARALIG